MNKAILVLAAVLATGTLVQTPAAEARGLRIGFGFGVPFATRPQIADPSILESAERAKQRRIARERGAFIVERRPAPSVTHAHSAHAHSAHAHSAHAHSAKQERLAAARENQRQAASAAAKIRAEKGEKIAAAKAAAAAKSAAAAQAAKKVQVAKPAAAPAVVAAPVVSDADKGLLAAQEQQRIKAEEMLKTLQQTAAAPTAPVVPAKPRQSGGDAAPSDVAPFTLQPATVVAPVAAPAAAKPAQPATQPTPVVSGDCRRFIPGAGITVTVPCSE